MSSQMIRVIQQKAAHSKRKFRFNKKKLKFIGVTEAKLRKSIRFLLNGYLASLNDHTNTRKVFVNVQGVLNNFVNALVAAVDSCRTEKKIAPEAILNEFKEAIANLQQPEWV